jgi:N-acylglucosamine 2-epimerase
LRQLQETYQEGLLEDVLPFWLGHAIDREDGGFLFCLNRDGTVYDTDKGLWQHGRFVWLLSTLYRCHEPRPEWLQAARHGVEFLDRHGFADDGRMFFQVQKDGQPLRKRRYLFTEMFTAAAWAAYGAAASEPTWYDRGAALFDYARQLLSTPGALAAKVDPAVRPQKGLSAVMIQLVTAQILRECATGPSSDDRRNSLQRCIDDCLVEIEGHFLKPERQLLLETVGSNGEFLNHVDGRLLNPGHALETAWFILQEAKERDHAEALVRLGTQIVDWMLPRGWDSAAGGLLSFVDARGLPVQEYWHDMKFWWPHCEAMVATLLAYQLTGEERFARWHQQVHDYTMAHFPDPEQGEWFGYLHKDGSVANPVKGNLWKGPFHIPRMQWLSWQIAESML